MKLNHEKLAKLRRFSIEDYIEGTAQKKIKMFAKSPQKLIRAEIVYQDNVQEIHELVFIIGISKLPKNVVKYKKIVGSRDSDPCMLYVTDYRNDANEAGAHIKNLPIKDIIDLIYLHKTPHKHTSQYQKTIREKNAI